MVKRFCMLLMAALFLSIAANAQINEVKRLPGVDNSNAQNKYYDYDRGFWMAAEVNTAYACRMSHTNFGYAELDVVAGYRFSQYLKAGLGLGARYYTDNNAVRTTTKKWALPIYLDVRGNFIPDDYRNVVPFYAVDLGASMQGGFLFRPTVGLRIGQKRNAFIVGLGYSGQDLKTYGIEELHLIKYRKFVSMINLKLGYEF